MIYVGGILSRLLSQYVCNARSISHSIVACIIAISCVGLLGVKTPLKIEIIHIVPIVNNCICVKESLMVHFQCTQAAGYHYG